MRSANRYLALLVAAFVLLSPLARGAAEPARGSKGQGASKIPHEAPLRARALGLYKAEAKSDWSRFYEFVSPILKRSKPPEAFSEDFARGHSFEVIAYKILSIRALERDKIPPGVEAAAAVAMDVSVRFKNGKISKIPSQTDYWLFVDGEWYWSWRGWPYD
jgi:hypothetical protein